MSDRRLSLGHLIAGPVRAKRLIEATQLFRSHLIRK
jgi:hypothetical protein